MRNFARDWLGLPMLGMLALMPIVSGCSTASVDAKAPVELLAAEPPAGLTEACDPPAVLPGGPMAVGPVRDAWGHDRAALAACGDRHRGLAEYIHQLIQRLSRK